LNHCSASPGVAILNLNFHTDAGGMTMRTISVVFGVVGTMLMSTMSTYSHAQTSGPESDDARYSYNRVDDGILRLDMRSGEVSICNRAAGRWSCQPLPDDRSALGNDIARLQHENAVLKRALLDHGLPLPNGVGTDAARTATGDTKIDNDKNGDQAVKLLGDAKVALQVLVVKLWRELVAVFMYLQRDMLKKT
jgi:hypothetical protein